MWSGEYRLHSLYRAKRNSPPDDNDQLPPNLRPNINIKEDFRMWMDEFTKTCKTPNVIQLTEQGSWSHTSFFKPHNRLKLKLVFTLTLDMSSNLARGVFTADFKGGNELQKMNFKFVVSTSNFQMFKNNLEKSIESTLATLRMINPNILEDL
jgi:hypothetical protein